MTITSVPNEDPRRDRLLPSDLPEDRAGVYRVFGNPGRGKPDRKWEMANMRLITQLPGSWNGGKGKLYIHRLAESFLWGALRRCREAGVLDEIRTMGCFNFRYQRHDPKRPLSYHSWGIAIDINSKDNGGWYVRNPPAPWSAAWEDKYPNGLSDDLVRAWESVGWKWGGRWRGYVDPMHMCLVNG